VVSVPLLKVQLEAVRKREQISTIFHQNFDHLEVFGENLQFGGQQLEGIER
jgi:hypothetical protein